MCANKLTICTHQFKTRPHQNINNVRWLNAHKLQDAYKQSSNSRTPGNSVAQVKHIYFSVWLSVCFSFLDACYYFMHVLLYR